MGRDGFRLNRSQRMQLKAFVCVLGILFIIILLVAKIIIGFLHKEAKEEQPVEPYVPIVQVLNNVWILEEDENGILVFRDGERDFDEMHKVRRILLAVLKQLLHKE